MNHHISPQAHSAIRNAFDGVDYLRTLADREPAVFCELLGAVLSDEVSGSLALQEALTASGVSP